MGKKIFATVLAAVMLFSITGCHMVFTNEELDKEQVIAVVNGTEIKKETFLKDYQSYRTLYGITDANENSAANKEAVEELKKQVFEELVSYEVIYQKAVELGVAELSDEQKQELDTSVETRKTGIRSSVEEEVEEEFTGTEEEKQAEIERRAKLQEDTYGITDGSYRDRLARDYVKKNVREKLGEDYTVTDEALKAYYEENLASQKKTLDESPKNLDTYESLGYSLYIPSGLRYVKNLLVAIPEDIREQITDLRLEKKDEEADALRDQELAKIKTKAEEVYQKATAAGADFDAVLAEYGEDPGMKTEPTKSRGYRIYQGMEDFDTIFVEAGMALKEVGEVSPMTASDFGYYIIQYASDVESKTVPYEEAKSFLEPLLRDEEVGKLYDEKVEEWTEAADIEKYEDRIF